ncbi:MAG: vWA domain-containing protein [Xenococcus sp. MO_188.B8]|nr:vWA domain-containing protein [Xenococcus sp. MO_188.B8]
MSQKSTGLSITIASLTRKLSLALFLVGFINYPSLSQVKQAEIVGKPLINEDRVTIRIQVKGEEYRPITGLFDTDFRLLVDEQEVNFRPKDWKSPEETVPPRAWIIVLLDFSGSMQAEDSRGTTKIEGAIKATSKFIEVLGERGAKTQVAIVPFGEAGPGCEGYTVNNNTLDKFFSARDFKLQNYLDYLAKLTPCASTNLYEPLNQAIRFLANTDDPRFYVPEESNKPQPRLSIILLSDGYHNKPNEEQDFQTLKLLLRRNDQIIVHTLGYGLTPEQLGQKYKLGRPATRQDLGYGEGKVPLEEFVDRDRLAEIAHLTGGIAMFSGEAQVIASSLQIFLNALLGEYEITYTDPKAERARKHSIQVVVNYPDGSVVISEPKSYTTTVFGRSLPLSRRLTMLLYVFLLMGLGGILPFWFWGQWLKREALDD